MPGPEPASMRALRFHSYGEWADVLRLEDAPVPNPGADQVRVRVHACALNPMDWVLCLGFLPNSLPRGIGLDVSGRGRDERSRGRPRLRRARFHGLSDSRSGGLCDPGGLGARSCRLGPSRSGCTAPGRRNDGSHPRSAGPVRRPNPARERRRDDRGVRCRPDRLDMRRAGGEPDLVLHMALAQAYCPTSSRSSMAIRDVS